MVKTRKREPAGTPEKQKASRTSQRTSARKSKENETRKEELQQKVSFNDKIDNDNDKMTDNDNVKKHIEETKTIIALPDEEDKDLASTTTLNDITSPEETKNETKTKNINNNNDHNNEHSNNKNNEEDNKEDNHKEKEILLEDENFTEEEIAFFNETDDEDFNPYDNNQKDIKLISDDIEDYNDLRELDNEFVEYDATQIYKKDEEERKRSQPEDDIDLMMLEEDLVTNLDKKFEAQEDKIKKHVSIIDKNSNIKESGIKKQKQKEINTNTSTKIHTENNDKLQRNTIANTLPNIEDDCRFKAVMELPPSKAPMKDVTELIKKAFKAIQDKGGDAVGIAPWNEKNSNKDDKVWTSPKHIPSGPGSKTTLAKYISSYMQPKENKKNIIYLKIRLVNLRTRKEINNYQTKTLKGSIPKLGQKFKDYIEEQAPGFKLSGYPIPCQAAKITCTGWLFRTVKSISEEEVIPELRKLAKIPENIAIGCSWRVIKQRSGKPYPWDNDYRAPSALHIDTEEAYGPLLERELAKLFKKNTKNKIGGRRVRFIPCFSGPGGRRFNSTQKQDIEAIAGKQQYFVNSLTTILPTSYIANLDLQIGEQEYTLRRYLMALFPRDKITDRLFVSVDKKWNGCI